MKTLLKKIWENIFSPNTENAQRFLTWLKIVAGSAAAQQYFAAHNVDASVIIAGIGLLVDFIVSSTQKK